jgi:alpha-methylacyl-CoA racemase
VFKTKTRDEWCALMEHTDVCFAPVLTMAEAAEHPHNVARQMIIERDGMLQPAPAPRFSRTTPEIARSPQHPGQGTREALEDWGVAKDRIDELVESGAVVAN